MKLAEGKILKAESRLPDEEKVVEEINNGRMCLISAFLI